MGLATVTMLFAFTRLIGRSALFLQCFYRQIMYRGKGETAVGSEGNSWYGLHRAGDPMNDKDTDSLLYTSQWRTFTRPTSPGATTVQLDIVLYMKFNPPLNKKACIIVDYMIAE
jgi:hypothetical protein